MADRVVIGKKEFLRRRTKSCRHNNMVYNTTNETVECGDCKEWISPFQALLVTIDYWQDKERELKWREDAIVQLEEKKLHLLAARAMEKKWRSRSTIPCCPHCHEGLFPKEMLRLNLVDKNTALERRKFKGKK